MIKLTARGKRKPGFEVIGDGAIKQTLVPPLRRGLLVGYAYVTPDKIVYYGKLLASVIQSGVR